VVEIAEEEGNKQQVPQVPYSNPMSNFGNSIILLTNPENAVFKLECKFRNIKVKDDGTVVNLGNPLMNEYGIAQVIGLVESIVNENSVWAWIEDRDEVNGLRNMFADTLAKDLMMNRLHYGIIDPTARQRIFTESVAFTHLCIKRAFKQGERKFWKGSQQDVRHTVSNEGGNKRNFLGWFKK